MEKKLPQSESVEQGENEKRISNMECPLHCTQTKPNAVTRGGKGGEIEEKRGKACP